MPSTGKEKSKKNVLKNTGFFENIADISPVGITLVNNQGEIEYANKRAEEILGLKKGTITSRTYNHPKWKIEDFQGKSFPDEDLPYMQVKTKLKDVYDIRHTIEWPNGKKIYLSINASPLMDKNGSFKGMVATIDDITKQIESEKQLETYLKTSADILDSIPSGMYIYQFIKPDKLYLIDGNTEAEKLIGYKMKDIIGKEFDEIWPRAKEHGITEKYLQVIETGETFESEELFYKDNQLAGYYRIKAFLLPQNRLAVGFEDVTSIKKAQSEFKDIFENSPIGISYYNAKGECLKMNKAYMDMFGMKSMDLGKGLKLLEDPNISNEIKQKLLKGKTVRYEAPFDFDIVRKNKLYSTSKRGIIYTDVVIAPILSQIDNNVTGYIGQVKDITERKRLEEARKISLDMNQEMDNCKIHEILEEGIKHCAHLSNSSNGYFLHVKSSELLEIGMCLNQDCPIKKDKGELKIEKKSVWNKCIDSKKPLIVNSKKDKHKHHPDCPVGYDKELIVPLLEDKKVVALIGVGNKENDYNTFDSDIVTFVADNIWNIMRRKRSEQELIRAKEKAIESDKLKSAFLANMSHEIRTPMNGIVGFSDMLKNKNLDDDRKQYFIDIINKSSNQLLLIINDIIDISKIEAGQVNIVTTNVDIPQVVMDMHSMFLPLSKNKNITLLLKENLQSNIKVTTDEIKLKQIFSNLISNALKFTVKGSVEVGYTVKKNNIEFYVKDTGIGIPEEHHEIIFERFRQLDSGLKRSFGGTGLGLSITKALVSMLKGKIWLKSEPGTGTTFYFTIPYDNYKNVGKGMSEEEENLKKFASTYPDFNNKTILIVEDEETNYLYIKEILMATKVNTIRARNGLEAIEIFNKSKIDLILMDIKLPVKDGYDATREIRKISADVPIIAQTAYAFAEDRKKAIECGCDDYFSKPVKKEELYYTLSKYI